MRRALAVLLATLLFAAQLSARTSRDWENVKKLKPGTPALVLLWSGEMLRGRVDAVSDTSLRLTEFDRNTSTGAASRNEIARATIRRVVRIRHGHLPNPERWMIAGALVGGAVGVTSGAIYDGTHHANHGHWLTGGLGGAGLGFLASCVALAAVGTVDVGSEIFRRSVVYEDKSGGQTLSN